MKNWVDWQVVAFGFAALIFGFSFGVVWELPKIGDVFALIGAAIGVLGAYEIATRTERAEKAAKHERIRHLSNTFSNCLINAYNGMNLGTSCKPYINSAEKCLESLDQLPADQIPGNIIGVLAIYVGNSKASLIRAQELSAGLPKTAIWRDTVNAEADNFRNMHAEFEKRIIM